MNTTGQYQDENEIDDPAEGDGSGCTFDGAELDENGTCPFGHTTADQAAYDAHNQAEAERHDAECGVSFVTGPAHDPYGTGCDQPKGHHPGTMHEGDDPFGNGGRVRWNGGGACAGDPLPASNVEFIHPGDEAEPVCEHPNTACPRGCGCGCPPCAFTDSGEYGGYYTDPDGYDRNGATDGFHVYSDAEGGL